MVADPWFHEGRDFGSRGAWTEEAGKTYLSQAPRVRYSVSIQWWIGRRRKLGTIGSGFCSTAHWLCVNSVMVVQSSVKSTILFWRLWIISGEISGKPVEDFGLNWNMRATVAWRWPWHADLRLQNGVDCYTSIFRFKFEFTPARSDLESWCIELCRLIGFSCGEF